LFESGALLGDILLRGVGVIALLAMLKREDEDLSAVLCLNFILKCIDESLIFPAILVSSLVKEVDRELGGARINECGISR
jgi:hypothetical protein